MASQRSLSWSAALRDLKQDRAARPEVREERLRATAGLRGTPAVALSAWRGRSGRRYVVGVHDLNPDAIEGVVIAVRRCPAGIASVVAAEADAGEPAAFCRVARLLGATELHVHRLAETPAERAAIVADLL